MYSDVRRLQWEKDGDDFVSRELAGRPVALLYRARRLTDFAGRWNQPQIYAGTLRDLRMVAVPSADHDPDWRQAWTILWRFDDRRGGGVTPLQSGYVGDDPNQWDLVEPLELRVAP